MAKPDPTAAAGSIDDGEVQDRFYARVFVADDGDSSLIELTAHQMKQFGFRSGAQLRGEIRCVRGSNRSRFVVILEEA